MTDYLTQHGFKETAPNLWLRSPIRIDTRYTLNVWIGSELHKDVTPEFAKRIIESTTFRTKIKK